MTAALSSVIETTGIMAFTISGAFSAMQKRLDPFGVLMMGFVTAIGGGTIRDVLIGSTPVGWMLRLEVPLIILVTGIITILFKRYVKDWKVTLFLFDTLGLGLFTILGVKKGLDIHLHPAICVALGTISGCFGGIVRDMLLNQIPVLFRKEIYATACIAGAVVYLLLTPLLGATIAEFTGIALICTIRIISVRRNWSLPAV